MKRNFKYYAVNACDAIVTVVLGFAVDTLDYLYRKACKLDLMYWRWKRSR